MIHIEERARKNREGRIKLKVNYLKISNPETTEGIINLLNRNTIHHHEKDTQNIIQQIGSKENGGMQMQHIWTLENWEKNIDLTRENHRTGLRLRIDKEVDSEVRRACKEFAAFLRREYFFPIRVVVYVKKNPKIIAMDGDKVAGTFWRIEDDYTVEPYIRVAGGDYEDLCSRWGKERALTATLLTIAHELTHYFQWINSIKLTEIGEERQATKYAMYILDDYAETREHP